MTITIFFWKVFLLTKIDIYSGFLGAGKTTLIRKMIKEAYGTQQLVLIENDIGEISIDGGFLQDTGIQITEMSAGCICCSLVGDFGKALTQVIHDYHPDRIIIEPSGVGKLSDVIAAIRKVATDEVSLGYTVAVADANKVKVHMRNFGEFYNNQIETASTIILSRTDSIPQAKLDAAVAQLREHNSVATMVTTPWDQLTGQQLLEAMEHKQTLADELAEMEIQRLAEEEEECDDPECSCHHHHHDDDEEHEHHHHHHHHHHDHDEDEHECCCHHHDEDEEHEHHHHHHHHHHADEVFTTWGVETARKFSPDAIRTVLEKLDNGEYGNVLRAKGIVAAEDGTWIHFDHVPGEADVRVGSAAVMGRICVIGADLKKEAIAELFGV